MMRASSIERPFEVAPLEKALESNRTLQQTILRELQVLATRKAENRERAAHVTQLLSNGLRQPEPEPLPPKLRCNPYRYTSERFFVDKEGTEPEPNPDTVRRRKLEATTILCHRDPPWSDKESKLLSTIVSEQQQTSQSTADSHDSREIDFGQVATSLQTRKLESSKSGAQLGAVPRSAEHCRVQYERMSHSPRPMSREESLRISEMVHSAKQKGEALDWAQIAASLQDRTAWDCFVAYFTQIEPIRSETWTPEEDELFLKYVAAGGPQLIVDTNLVHQIIANLFPNKTKKQVINRINQTLLNPKVKHDTWSHDEERRLVILMKMYRDSPQDLYMASTHFNRSTKSVLDKWNRTLSPAFLARPFTKEEDKALMDVVRSVGNDIGWTELSEKHFPDRHPQRLMNRWSELASDQDILEREGDTIFKPSGKRKGSTSSRHTSIVNADDYIVQVVKKPKL